MTRSTRSAACVAPTCITNGHLQTQLLGMQKCQKHNQSEKMQ